MSRRFIAVAAFILNMAATALLAMLSAGLFQSWGTWGRAAAIVGCVMVLTVLGVVRLHGREGPVRTFLNDLHTRNWSKSGGRDTDYRVSLFVVSRGFHLGVPRLRCVYRTDGRPCRKKWSTVPPPGRDADGVVGYVWRHEIDPNIRALSFGHSQIEYKDYLKSSCVTEEMYKKLTWQGAAMRGVPVRTSAAGDPIGVLLVECRIHGTEIQLTSNIHSDAKICGLIYGGWL